MKIIETELKDVYLIEPTVLGDYRGWFMETFRDDRLREAGLDLKFVQDNQSMSAVKGTLRGIHFQNFPYAQTKLVRCVKGEILDVAIDLRPSSPNYKKWVAVVLSAENKKQLLVPRGFGHAFLTLTDNAEVAYKVDEYYNKNADSGVKFDDADLGVEFNILSPILSEKDKLLPALKNINCNFGARILVTGYGGQLGYDVVKLLKSKSVECRGVDVKDFDLTDEKAVSSYIRSYKPTAIIHCAAYTAVDRAEDESELCFKVNALGTKNLVAAAKEADAKFMYISTDYVYSGQGDASFSEDVKPSPLNVYGESKLAGENEVRTALEKHFILRTSWVFGRNGNNFVKTMLRLAKEREFLSVVSDQTGSPTYTPDLSALIVDMIFSDKYGTYNASNEGFCSWKEFADQIFSAAGIKIKVNSTTTDAYPTKAKRPLNSRLDKSKLIKNGFKALPDWKDALKRYLEEILAEEH